MRRENKFRGKRVDNGEWVTGSMLTGFFFRGGEDIPYIMTSEGTDYDCFEDIQEGNGIYEVIPETVGQYTGINDKNGKKIFEGDIVDNSYINPLSNSEVIQRYVIRWENGIYRMIFIDSVPKKYYDRMLFLEFNQVELIGNICDNTELLQEVAEK